MKSLKCDADRRRAVEKLPPGLPETYQRILEKIHGEDMDLARNALKWLICCSRPLTLTELAIAIAIRPGRPFNDEEKLDDDELLLEILGSLVRLNRLTKTIDLAHFSVTEYLTTPYLADGTPNLHFINPEVGHVDLLESCLTYMSFIERDLTSDVEVNDPEDSFLQYATFHWSVHAKRTEDKTKSRELVTLFLKAPESTAYIRWSACWENEFDPNLQVALPSTHSGIYYAALFSLPYVVQNLIEDPNAHEAARSIALLGAARDGNTEVVRILLGGDRTEIARTVLGWTALHRAAYNSHIDVVLMLLNSGFQVNLTDDDGWIALHIAVSEGYEDTVKLLLEMGANVSMQLTESGWTPLHLAAQHGRVGIARALLDAGANVLQQENTGLDSLHIAASYEQDSVIRLLLERCARASKTQSHINRAKQGIETPAAELPTFNTTEDDVLQTLQYLVESFPEDVVFDEALGDFYLRRKRYSVAFNSYQKYIYLNPINTAETNDRDLSHKPYYCHNCSNGGTEFIQGYRFKCTLCRRFDLCGKCFDAASCSHFHERSEFLRFPIEKNVRTGARN